MAETLDLLASRALLKKFGVPLNKAKLARTARDAAAIAKGIGYPVAMKIVSPEIVHKTDIGGVRVNITNDRQASAVFREMTARAKAAVPGATIRGVHVEEMVERGVELIIGASMDPQFGRMIMLGLGGILVEVFKDVSFRLIPISPVDAREMIEDLKGKALLEGVRGKKPLDKERLAEILLTVSRGLETHPEIQELDINPLIGTEKGWKAVDARIVVSAPAP